MDYQGLERNVRVEDQLSIGSDFGHESEQQVQLSALAGRKHQSQQLERLNGHGFTFLRH